jgi:citrate synthase
VLQAPKGLEGVIVAETHISKIDGQAGKLVYHGYDIAELAGNVQFEAVAHLLIVGRLPNPEELKRFKNRLAENRFLSNETMAFLETAPREANPLAVLRTAVSLMGLKAKEAMPPVDTGVNLIAQFPTIIATYHHARRREGSILPRGDLDHAGNFLFMLSGRIPKDQHSHALDSYMTLLADHSMNASTFAARIAISTLTDVYSAITAAIGTLKGPLHGGAPSEVWSMLQDIGDPVRADKWLSGKLEKKEKIMGFGHRVYRTEDPRSKILKNLAKQIANPKTFELAETVERDARKLLQTAHPERPLDTNVEFYSSLVLNAVGIPTDMFTSTFASARVAGWTAHILEQLADNKLIRPSANYVGPEGLSLIDKP